MKSNSVVSKLIEEILPTSLTKTKSIVMSKKGGIKECLRKFPTSPFMRKSSTDIESVDAGDLVKSSCRSCACGLKLSKREKKNQKPCTNGIEAETDEENYLLSLMFYAVQYRNSELLEEVISKSTINTNLLNVDGIGALHFAAIVGSTDCISVLQKHGCCVNMLDVRGQTPLYYAHVMENKETAAKLIQLGAR